MLLGKLHPAVQLRRKSRQFKPTFGLLKFFPYFVNRTLGTNYEVDLTLDIGQDYKL